jgi:uncharacterized protein
MPNPVVHTELNTNDVAKAKDFYTRLFDWTLTDTPMGEGVYTMIKTGPTSVGGLMQHPMPGAPSMWLPYVEVDDIKASTAKAKSMGATIIQDVTEVMGAGFISIFTDPTGATIGLWAAKS